MSKFKIGDKVYSLINTSGICRGSLGEVKEIIPIIGDITDYKVSFSDGSNIIMLRENDLIPAEKTNSNYNVNILKYLSDDEIQNICRKIWSEKAEERFTDVMNARSLGKPSWVDEIISNAAENYTQKLLEDNLLRKQFNEAFMSLMISELEKEKQTNEYEDIVREHIKWKLQTFAEDYIKEHKEELEIKMGSVIESALKELSIDKISEGISKVLSNYINSIFLNATPK